MISTFGYDYAMAEIHAGLWEIPLKILSTVCLKHKNSRKKPYHDQYYTYLKDKKKRGIEFKPVKVLILIN